ncbi:GNAT family N-acetyltransferase [Nesterenkonia ebinurensis]|uniref:GNAT family N-acetyltransferase n=1 Tax=Nesterenkonia ebinurensis TaxID=2608252 RepID=UPI00123D1063|nr:GNAT family N-acetyltransferase [Nesterenkonia ebinurensis]
MAAMNGNLQIRQQITTTPVHRERARVAELDGSLIGLAMVGKPEDQDTETSLQLYLIYLLAEHHGCGAASRLLTELLGEQPASLWVFKDNPRAQGFYRKHGFEPDGSEKDLGEEENDASLRGVVELCMVRR